MADAYRSDRRSALRLAPRTVPVRSQSRLPVRSALDRAGGVAGLSLAPGMVEVRVQVEGEEGLVEARRQSRELASRGGFGDADRAMIAAMVSELGRNILRHASRGEISLALIKLHRRVGLRITAQDRGPGIADLGRVLRTGGSAGDRPGIGLAGVKRLADDFEITSAPWRGTVVVAGKWRR